MYNAAHITTPSTAASTPSMDNMDQHAAQPSSTPPLHPVMQPNVSEPVDANSDIATGSPQIALPQQHMIQVSADEYADLMREIRAGQIAKRVKAMGNEYTTRRNTLIIRKAGRLYPDLVSDEEVIAYYDLYKMREAVTSAGKKVNVEDKEVEAYLDLWTGPTTPSLEAVENLIASRSV